MKHNHEIMTSEDKKDGCVLRGASKIEGGKDMQTYPDSEEPSKTASKGLKEKFPRDLERSRCAFDRLMKFCRYVKKMYELTERLSVDEFLRGTPGQRYKYE